MIGIIVADINEVKKIKETKLRSETKGNFTFNIYKINNQEVVVVHSGIGIVNAGCATQALIDFYQVKAIYNYGAVGASDKLKVFDLVKPEKVYYHDVLTPWYPRGQVPQEKPFFSNDLKNTKYNLATGMTFLDNKDSIKDIQKEIDADIFDMESAAIAQVASKNKVKLYIIKCVSDIIGSDSNELLNINERISKAGEIALAETLKLICK